MIRLQRMYNFFYSMLVYISLSNVFYNVLDHFSTIYETKLLTRCPVPVDLFSCLFVSEKLVGEVSRNQLKIYGNYFYIETKTAPEGGLQGGPTGARRPPGEVQGGSWLGPTWPPPEPSRDALSPINSIHRGNPQGVDHISIKHLRTLPSPTNSGGSEAFSAPAGGGDHHQRHLHHHACLRSDA